jgi:hypothetical protein
VSGTTCKVCGDYDCRLHFSRRPPVSGEPHKPCSECTDWFAQEGPQQVNEQNPWCPIFADGVCARFPDAPPRPPSLPEGDRQMYPHAYADRPPVSGEPSTAPRRVSEMGDEEVAFSRAWHEMTCVADGLDHHPLEDHEPFDVEESDFDWPDFIKALSRYGYTFAARATPPSLDEPTLTRILSDIAPTVGGDLLEGGVPYRVGLASAILARLTSKEER